jgi:hypothetical protein
MTSRNLPAIKRVRQTRYASSDGRLWDSHIAAFRHETFIALHGFITQRLIQHHDDAEELARSLLDAEDFRIVLLGPKTGVRQTGQGPAGPQQGRLGSSGDDERAHIRAVDY